MNGGEISSQSERVRSSIFCATFAVAYGSGNRVTRHPPAATRTGMEIAASPLQHPFQRHEPFLARRHHRFLSLRRHLPTLARGCIRGPGVTIRAIASAGRIGGSDVARNQRPVFVDAGGPPAIRVVKSCSSAARTCLMTTPPNQIARTRSPSG
jgi:hypothetical protein